MFYSSNKADDNSNKPQDKFTSTFITVMMVVFVFGSVFRKMYNDQPVFKIEKKKYSISHCRKYMAYIDCDESLSKDEKFRRYFYEILHIARKKTAISHLCHSLGFKISHSDLMQSILNDPSFFANGSFSRQKFLSFLKQRGISENEFYELRSEELMHQQFWYFLKNSYSLPDGLAKDFNDAYFAIRRIKFAKVVHSDIKLQYSEKDLLAFYKKNKDKFMTIRQYTYEGLIVSTKNFSNEDYTFLNRVVKNDNFDGVFKNYKYAVTHISNEGLIKKFGNGLSFYDYGQDLLVGKCFAFNVDDSVYVIKVTSVEEPKLKPFKEVKNQVIRLYEKEKKPLAIHTNSLNWNTIYCSADDFYTLNLPYNLAKKLVCLPVGKLVSFHENGVSYFFVLDSIASSKNKDSSDFLLHDFLDAEIQYAVEKYLVGFAEEV